MKTPKFLSSLPTRADLVEMRAFLLLWSTQALSSLGSSMTAFALVVWSYEAEGSALTTALLSVCSYAPYVAMSIFAGALSDKWNKKATLLICDTAAAACTVAVLVLLQTVGFVLLWTVVSWAVATLLGGVPARGFLARAVLLGGEPCDPGAGGGDARLCGPARRDRL